MNKNSTQPKYFSLLGDINIKPTVQTMNEPVSIPEAARSLNVSQSTVWNYIKKGILEKVVKDRKTYISRDSIDKFAQSGKQIVSETVPLSQGKATVEVSYLEEVFTQLGQLKAEKQYFLEYRGYQEDRTRELEEAKARIVELESKESEIRARAVGLEKENKNIRTILWILVGVGLSLSLGTISLLLKRI